MTIEPTEEVPKSNDTKIVGFVDEITDILNTLRAAMKAGGIPFIIRIESEGVAAQCWCTENGTKELHHMAAIAHHGADIFSTSLVSDLIEGSIEQDFEIN